MDNELINNRYEVISQIGLGGAGAIFQAYDTFLDRKVAIKKIFVDSHDQVERLKRECLFLQTIDHPNLVKAHEFFITNDRAYMVLEFIDGKSIDEIIVKNKYSMTLVGQLAIASQIARGIEVMNMGGIIHRDIKPQNVMLNPQTGEIKIVDLGTAKSLSKALSSITTAGSVIGTCAYMSPEQTKGAVCWSTDIFSLGVLLYQFFTWSERSPFYTNNIYATIKKIRDEKLIDLCTVVDISEASPEQQIAYEKISEVLVKALHKDPDVRWQNAGVIADLFNDIRMPLLGEAQENPHKYRIETARQICPGLRKELESMRKTYSTIG
ncbi:serine/threonine-protein kinase [Candidatus Uabimicrobium sp. HlEnr_7]|uniref:serine/threonine-protein kinase n=1 Tax=Candidatus Uabimicrobium helgolandensis TaxID=3095367 RepID=UPI003556D71F